MPVICLRYLLLIFLFSDVEKRKDRGEEDDQREHLCLNPPMGTTKAAVVLPDKRGSILSEGVTLTQNVVLAERAGLLQEKPRIHAVPVKLMQAWQHSKTLLGKGGNINNIKKIQL